MEQTQETWTHGHNDTAMSAMQILNTRGVYH